MTTVNSAGAVALAAPVTSAAATDPNDPANFPPRDVQVERTGLKASFAIPGVVVGGAGLAAAGVTMLSAIGPSARVHAGSMIAFGGMIAAGAAALVASQLFGPSTKAALAAGIPTREQAQLVDAKISGATKIVQTEDGTFAILRDRAPSYGGGGGGGGSSRTGGNSGYRPSPSYPSSSGGRTSSGDSYRAPSYPSPSSGRTSPGDSYSGSSSSRGNSTSNGNPSYDDF